MELVANVWPVVDQVTGTVMRFFLRAYATEADDATISRTLTALAPSDYLAARVFPNPERFRFMTPIGPQAECVTTSQFHQHTFDILEPALKALEASHPRLQGIASQGEELIGIGQIPRFAQDPYLVVTVLLETPDGQLVPQLQQR